MAKLQWMNDPEIKTLELWARFLSKHLFFWSRHTQAQCTLYIRRSRTLKYGASSARLHMKVNFTKTTNESGEYVYLLKAPSPAMHDSWRNAPIIPCKAQTAGAESDAAEQDECGGLTWSRTAPQLANPGLKQWCAFTQRASQLNILVVFVVLFFMI